MAGLTQVLGYKFGWVCLICAVSPHSNGAVQIRVGVELAEPTHQTHAWEGRKVPTKSLFEQEAPNIGTPEVFDQTRCSRTFACRICPEYQRTGQGRSVQEKIVRANDPIKMKK